MTRLLGSFKSHVPRPVLRALQFVSAAVIYYVLIEVLCAPPTLNSRAALPPTYSVKLVGNATSNIPNVYRDGGGGGILNGINFIWFADTITTTFGEPEKSTDNWLDFTTNTIAYSGYNGGGPHNLQDFGTTSPEQQIPLFYDDGESDEDTAIWPNQNFASSCSGGCGISFPPVLNRNETAGGGDLVYNTGVSISAGEFGPEVSRPVQALFYSEEPQFGSFSSVACLDGYIYTFAAISETREANGLKLARVPSTTPFTRSEYRFWNGRDWDTTIPTFDDGGAANVLNFSTEFFGAFYGPGSGDIFFSNMYGVYLNIFGLANSAVESNIYLSYSSILTSGWSTPIVIYTTPTLGAGYNYNIHAYPLYDAMQKIVPISWTQYPGNSTYYTAFANITFH